MILNISSLRFRGEATLTKMNDLGRPRLFRLGQTWALSTVRQTKLHRCFCFLNLRSAASQEQPVQGANEENSERQAERQNIGIVEILRMRPLLAS